METLITTFISIFASIILTIIGIRYSSRFHIRKIGVAKERYSVIEKISHGTKDGFIDSARIALVKSSEENAMGFMDVSLTEHPENIFVDRYAFTHTFIHNIYAPGKIILHSKLNWTENTPSNLFSDYVISSRKLDSVPINLIKGKVKKMVNECRAVESTFSFPSTYPGPRYKRRLLIIAKGIGIVYSETIYINGGKDVYVLEKYKVRNGADFWFPVNSVGNYWEYKINYEYGKNVLNISE